MADTMERAAVRVGGVEIPAAAIAAEAQNHPAQDADSAWTAAAEALVIRQLLLDEADRQGIVDRRRAPTPTAARWPEEDARIDALLAGAVRVPPGDQRGGAPLLRPPPRPLRQRDADRGGAYPAVGGPRRFLRLWGWRSATPGC